MDLKVAKITGSEFISDEMDTASSFRLGGSDFYSRIALHIGILRDPSESFTNRCASFECLREQYGDLHDLDGPFENAIRTVAEETSEMGRKLKPMRAALECRDAFVRISSLLPKAESARAEALLSLANDPAERLKALEDLFSFHHTRPSEDEQAISKRALTIIVEGLVRDASQEQNTTPVGEAAATANERLHKRVMELALLFAVVGS